jgi:hypothetical protein
MRHRSDVDDIDTFLLQPLANSVLCDLLPYVEDKQASSLLVCHRRHWAHRCQLIGASDDFTRRRLRGHCLAVELADVAAGGDRWAASQTCPSGIWNGRMTGS